MKREPIFPFSGTGPDFPPFCIFSLDDAQIKSILVKLGLPEGFEPLPDLGRLRIRVVVYGRHPTHWFLFALFAHAPNPVDNGYTLEGFPKSRYNASAFLDCIRHFCGRHQVNITSVDTSELTREQN